MGYREQRACAWAASAAPPGFVYPLSGSGVQLLGRAIARLIYRPDIALGDVDERTATGVTARPPIFLNLGASGHVQLVGATCHHLLAHDGVGLANHLGRGLNTAQAATPLALPNGRACGGV